MTTTEISDERFRRGPEKGKKSRRPVHAGGFDRDQNARPRPPPPGGRPTADAVPRASFVRRARTEIHDPRHVYTVSAGWRRRAKFLPARRRTVTVDSCCTRAVLCDKDAAGDGRARTTCVQKGGDNDVVSRTGTTCCPRRHVIVRAFFGVYTADVCVTLESDWSGGVHTHKRGCCTHVLLFYDSALCFTHTRIRTRSVSV